MAANEIHMNDVGTRFLVTVTDGTSAVDISSATTKQLIFQKPSGTKLTKATAFTNDGTDGKMQYNIVSEDFDEAGSYKLQGKVVISDGTFYTDKHTFKVHRNL